MIERVVVGGEVAEANGTFAHVVVSNIATNRIEVIFEEIKSPQLRSYVLKCMN